MAGIETGTPMSRALRKGHVQPDRMHQCTLQNIIQRRAEQILRARRDEHDRPLMTTAEAAIAARAYSRKRLKNVRRAVKET
jgi:hypothetical protein